MDKAVAAASPGLRLAVFCLLTLFAAALVPSSGQAAFISMGADAGPSGQGDSCAGGGVQFNVGGGILPAFAFFSCTNFEGSSGATATASQGGLGASAHALSKVGVNLGSSSAEGAGSDAGYRDNTLIFLCLGNCSSQTTTTINMNFSASTSDTSNIGDAAAHVDATAFVDGQLAEECHSQPPGGNQCSIHPVTVPLDTFVEIDLTLEVGAFANASGLLPESGDQHAEADASHTFSFPLDGPVFNLDPGITVTDESAFISNNIYSPPRAAAAVPEPGSLMLLLSALISLIVVIRMRPCSTWRVI